MKIWRPVTSNIPQGHPVLGCIYVNGLDSGTECTLSKVAEDAKLGEVVDIPDGCAAIQWDLNRMKALQHLYWGSPVQERHGDTTVSPAKGHCH